VKFSGRLVMREKGMGNARATSKMQPSYRKKRAEVSKGGREGAGLGNGEDVEVQTS